MVEPSTRSERFPNERERFSGSSTIRNSFNQAGPPPRGPAKVGTEGRVHVALLSDSMAQHVDRSRRAAPALRYLRMPSLEMTPLYRSESYCFR